MAPFVAALVAKGLPLLANAFLAKGKEYVEEKTGMKFADTDKFEPNEQELLQLRQAELEHEEELQKLKHEDNKLDLEYFREQQKSVDSARRREVDIANSSGASWLAINIVPILALSVVWGGGTMLYLGEENLQLSVSNIIMLVLGYYFGTSVGSREKQKALDKVVMRQGDAQ